jgi:hypothetical protein
MCLGVSYRRYRKPYESYYPQSGACLPVRLRSGATALVPWGRRPSERGRLPITGWARLNSIKRGFWHVWHPMPVKVAVVAWMEKVDGLSYWHALAQHEYVQGLVARAGNELRAYIVTVDQDGETPRVIAPALPPSTTRRQIAATRGQRYGQNLHLLHT